MTRQLSQTAEANLRFIRGAMERAERTSSVSGLSGMAMGVIALVAAVLAAAQGEMTGQLLVWIVAAAFAASAGVVGAWIKSQRLGTGLLNESLRRFLLCMLPVVAVGVLLTVALWPTPYNPLLPSFWMLLYGCGLTAAGTYAARPIMPMGICFLVIGCTAYLLGSSWANLLLGISFGGLHLFFGYQVYRYHGG